MKENRTNAQRALDSLGLTVGSRARTRESYLVGRKGRQGRDRIVEVTITAIGSSRVMVRRPRGPEYMVYPHVLLTEPGVP